MNNKSNRFFWGTSTSAHQIEGDNTHSDWWAWEQQGNIADQAVSGDACKSNIHFEKDLEAMRSLNVNAYRFSIEWAKIEPKPGKFDTNVTFKERAPKKPQTLIHISRKFPTQ